MTIHIPSEELLAVSRRLDGQARPTLREAEGHARAADEHSDGIIHQGAASKVEAVAQKLRTDLSLGDAAVSGLTTGLADVVARFGRLDASAHTPDLGAKPGPR
jgi:hypothetical protein